MHIVGQLHGILELPTHNPTHSTFNAVLWPVPLAGLGGGMGPFLVEPIVEDLRSVLDSPAPLHGARRLLEVLVPLVYRPAIKSALLGTDVVQLLANVLGEWRVPALLRLLCFICWA